MRTTGSFVRTPKPRVRIFGGGFAEEMADALLRRLGFGDGMELWAAEADGEIVSAGPWSRCPPRSSPGSGAAPRFRNGVGAGSTGRSRRPVHDQRLCLARG